MKLEERPVLVKTPETARVRGLYKLVSHGYTCVSTPSKLKWVLQKWVKLHLPKASIASSTGTGIKELENPIPLSTHTHMFLFVISHTMSFSNVFLCFPFGKTPFFSSMLLNIIWIIILLCQSSCAWIVPQSQNNIWINLAQAPKEDHVSLLMAAAENPMSKATLQNHAAIDFLVFAHGHGYEDFEGLC